MNDNEDTMPRNLLFMITLIGSLILAYFLNPFLLPTLVSTLDIDMTLKFKRALADGTLWGIASFWCTLAFLMFLVAFLIPAVVNMLNLVKLKSRLAELPRTKDIAVQVTKERFLKTFSEFPFIYSEFAVPFSDFIIEKNEKDIKRKTNFIGKGKAQKVNPVIVSSVVPAGDIFKMAILLNSRLSIWFMRPLSRVLSGVGFLMFILSVAGVLQMGEDNVFGDKALELLLMGISSLSVCVGFAVLIAGLQRMILGHLYHRGREIVKMVDSLFHYKPADENSSELKSVETALNKTVSSFKDFSKILVEKQEEKVNELIVNTLDDYVKKIGESTEAQSMALQKIVDDGASLSVDISKQLTSRFEEYAKKISDIHDKMDGYQDKSYGAITENIETLIVSLNEDVKSHQEKYQKSIDNGFAALDKQLKLASQASSDSEKVLDSLKKAASDLKTVSSASDKVTGKFDDVAAGLERVFLQIEKIAPLSPQKKEKIINDLEELKNNNKTVGMGRAAPAKAKK